MKLHPPADRPRHSLSTLTAGLGRVLLLAGVVLAPLPRLAAEDTLPLWPANAVPGLRHERPEELRDPKRADGQPSRSYWYVSEPTLTLFPVSGATAPGPAVLVLPGGGYQQVVFDKEGVEIARWLNSLGFSAAVLKYRTRDPDRAPSPEVLEATLADAQQAMRLLRSRAPEWKLDPQRVGAIGFSAGGDLALRLTVAAAPEAAVAGVPFEQLNTRPDFLVLVYGAGRPVPKAKLGPRFPPVFIAHAADDPKVPVAFATELFAQLQKAGVPAELHVFTKGDHGFALRNPGAVLAWTTLFQAWAGERGLIGTAAAKQP
jgi:acetyl esterase/lipase